MKQVIMNYAILFLFLGLASSIQAKDYYLSSSKGKDSNEGTATSPWQTIDKINTIKLEAGDKVLFQRGDTFLGHFIVNGSGSSSDNILISSYGKGNLPILSGAVGKENGGDYQEAILVKNNDHISFENIEVQNERLVSREGVRDKDAYGIQILNSGVKSLKHFRFKGVTVRKVYAALPVKKEEGENAFNGLEVAGIRFFSSRNNKEGKEKNIQDVIMEECYFTDLQRLGVHIKHGGGITNPSDKTVNLNKDFIFRNNKFEYLGGTCILPIRTFNVLIEDNIFDHPGDNSDPRMPARGSAVWTWRCENTVIQYNKCLHIRGYLDSHGVHIDHENVNTFIQYNYMEDCEGGFVEILGGNINSVYRYNISVNDGWRVNPKWKTSNHTIWINDKVPNGHHQCDSSYIYNNTVIMDSAYATSIDIKGKNTFIFNNIFYVKKGSVGQKQTNIRNFETTFFLSNNLYYGNISEKFKDRDRNPIVGNPNLVSTQENFTPLKDSPVIGQGIMKLGPPVPGAGKGVFKTVTEYPEVDFYGNKIDYTKGLSIGAINTTTKKNKNKRDSK